MQILLHLNIFSMVTGTAWEIEMYLFTEIAKIAVVLKYFVWKIFCIPDAQRTKRQSLDDDTGDGKKQIIKFFLVKFGEIFNNFSLVSESGVQWWGYGGVIEHCWTLLRSSLLSIWGQELSDKRFTKDNNRAWDFLSRYWCG